MFLVAKNGEIIYERYQGFANEETDMRFNAETPVHVASISKTITSIAVLRLVDQRKIQLDKDIRHYLPQIPYKGITVRMLLNHRSGNSVLRLFSKRDQSTRQTADKQTHPADSETLPPEIVFPVKHPVCLLQHQLRFIGVDCGKSDQKNASQKPWRNWCSNR